MSLKYTILGLIKDKPMHGYEIKNIFSVSFARFWRVSPGQLYPLLRKILDEGLAKKSVHIQDGKPNAHVYSITKKGREEFKEWLNEPSDQLPLIRFDLMLKLFFYGQKNHQNCLNELKLLQEASKVFLADLGQKHDDLKNQLDPYQLLILEGGIDMAKCSMKWVNKIESKLKKDMQSENI
ncbi:MAG: PadR family transcriptional regulator [Gammaproteobacteria bacterium]|nr:PadR family transcriptional regulator [Gammaproteobacteria bacterium]